MSTWAARRLLRADSPLPRRPRRVVVAGGSGSGKTSLVRRIAAVLEVPHVELDALFHGPGWVPRPEFEDDVRRFAAGEAWVTEWMYDGARDLLADRADLLVWLDLPRARVMRQVVRRTVVRRLRRTELWNGNVEPPLLRGLIEPGSVIRWAWTSHPLVGERVRGLTSRREDLPVVRLASHSETAAWIEGPLARAAAD